LQRSRPQAYFSSRLYQYLVLRREYVRHRYYNTLVSILTIYTHVLKSLHSKDFCARLNSESNQKAFLKGTSVKLLFFRGFVGDSGRSFCGRKSDCSQFITGIQCEVHVGCYSQS
jgi:hypothetical protein